MHVLVTIASIGDRTPKTHVVLTGPSGAAVSLSWVANNPTRAMNRHTAQANPLADDAAVLGAPPLVNGALILEAASSIAHSITDSPNGEILSISGRGAGGRWPLSSRRTLLGRSKAAGIHVNDPAISREHCLIETIPGDVRVVEIGPAGTRRPGGSAIGEAWSSWPPETPLKVGHTEFVHSRALDEPIPLRADLAGHFMVSRSPRLRHPTAPRELTPPPAPTRDPKQALSQILLWAPLLVAGLGAWLMKSPMMLLFGLMSPVMVLANHVATRASGRRTYRQQTREYAANVSAFESDLADALSGETMARHREQPDLATVRLIAEGPTRRIWERRPGDDDFSVLRLGLADLPARTVIAMRDSEGVGSPELVRDVPLTLDIAGAGVVGVAGPRGHRHALAESLLVQLATWHSPDELRIVLFGANSGSRWSWAGQLPHLDPLDASTALRATGFRGHGPRPLHQVQRRAEELVTLVRARQQANRHTPHSPAIVVFLDDAHELRALPGIPELLSAGPAVGVYAVCFESAESLLPGECTATIDVADPAAAVLRTRSGRQPFAADFLAPGVAAVIARALAPLRDSGSRAGGAGLPQAARLLDIVGPSLVEDESLARRWAQSPATTKVPVGLGVAGPVTIDVAADGPHLLIGGTTGAGKSEFLQTLVASLALANSPERLGFVLIDYKGGAAFRECAHLPHALGLVTDLDPHLTERALTSLHAELKRREHLLNAAGESDLVGYNANRPRGADPLARLVIVIDEFRALAEELPDFMRGMIRIAALGRSLGVHLVLATQRPGGIVSPEIKANVNLRVALRMRDRADSTDIIESTDAALLPASAPGRAFVRAGGDQLVSLQTARVTLPSASTDGDLVLATELTAYSLGEPPPRLPTPSSSSDATDLDLIVSAAQRATTTLSLVPPPSPWLPPLPDEVPLDEIAVGSGGEGRVAAFALGDDPQHQRRTAISWDLESDGPLGVVGSARSGRTTALRAIAADLASRHTPDEIHLHALDAGSGMSAIADLPHTGTIVSVGDSALMSRLVECLSTELDRRKRALAELGLTSAREQRRHAAARGQPAWPRIVLLMDGWEAVATALESPELLATLDALTALIRDGSSLGLDVAMTGSPRLLGSRIGALLGRRIILELSDPMDLAACGVPKSALPVRWTPGRGVCATSLLEIQIGYAGNSPLGADQMAFLRNLGKRLADNGIHPDAGLIRLRPLPSAVTLAELGTAPRRVPDLVPLGVGGDRHEALGLVPGEDRGFLVVGCERSGRTTALVTLAVGLAETGRSTAIVRAPGRSRSADGVVAEAAHAGIALFAPDDTATFDAWLKDHDQVALLIDDLDTLAGTPMEALAETVWEQADPHVAIVAASITTAGLTSAFRGLPLTLARRAPAVILGPTLPGDGAPFGIRLPRTTARLPGRGFYIADGTATPIHIAQLDQP